MVVLAGLVWNAPTSCAWASRVMVNSRAARNHGLKAVGLPSSHVVTHPGSKQMFTVCVRERETDRQTGDRGCASTQPYASVAAQLIRPGPAGVQKNTYFLARRHRSSM
jgi:hypothetical protein